MKQTSTSHTGLFSKLKGLRQAAKGSIIFDGKAVDTQGRENLIAQEATETIREALNNPQPLYEQNLIGINRTGFKKTSSREVIVTDRQMEDMREDLSKAARLEAASRVRTQRGGARARDLPEPPQLHKAKKVTFEGRTIKLHLGSRGAAGRNIIAVPKMVQKDGAAIQFVKGVNRMEVDLAKPGKQSMHVAPESLVQGAQNLSLEVCFSDQRENLREKNNQRG